MLSVPPTGYHQNLHVNSFNIDYNEGDGSISQFYSDIVIQDKNGKKLKEKTISVNKPMRYGGITVYQVKYKLN